MELTTYPNKTYFEISEGESLAEVSFPLAPADGYIGNYQEWVAFVVANGVQCTVYEENGLIVTLFSRDTSIPVVVPITLPAPAVISPPMSAWFEVGSTVFQIAATGAVIAPSPEGLVLTLNESESRLVWTAGIRAMQVAFASTTLSVDPGIRWPEFSVSLWDEQIATDGALFTTTLTRLRPLRHGFPVISTVPVDQSDNATIPTTDLLITSTEVTDRKLLQTGASSPRRIVTFRILSSEPIATAFASSLVLRVMRPNGVDTVTAPEDVALTPAAAVGGFVSEWRARKEFAQEDGIDWVDGFAYITVYMPLTVQKTLPLRLHYEPVSPP